MNGTIKLAVNLATRPKRNRRFFRAAGAGLLLLALLTGWLGLGSFIRARRIQTEASAETNRLEVNRSRQDQLRAERENESRRLKTLLKDKVAIANQALTMKGFSWVEFFSLLEQALPASSYISSMAPVSSVDGKIEVRFKVVSPSLGDTLQLVQNLASTVGRAPLVQSETKAGGQTISEITLTYERIR
ncbi:MAG: hypothetical protein NTZ26_00685 [Candidatus Aminicenantes bacterium]|nr:hypothetical protein [Candidatus Aminicenantes bacterium]